MIQRPSPSQQLLSHNIYIMRCLKTKFNLTTRICPQDFNFNIAIDDYGFFFAEGKYGLILKPSPTHIKKKGVSFLLTKGGT